MHSFCSKCESYLFFSGFFRSSENKSANRDILLLCWMSFYWGMATSMMFMFIPVFVIDEIGGSAKSFGLLEGGVIFLSFIARLCSGFLIDLFKKKMPMLKFGTILTIISKVFVACSCNVLFVFFAKSLDRFAKGIRIVPSDAIISELSSQKSLAYSIRNMMNFAGSLCGSLLTFIISYFFGQNFRLIFILATLPTILAFHILKNKIQYKEELCHAQNQKKFQLKNIGLLPKEYWQYIAVITTLMLARFDIGFVTIRSRAVLENYIINVPIFMAIYEICIVLVAVPVGKLAEKISNKLILVIGIAVLFIANIIGLFANSIESVFSIYLASGIHMGITHGVIYSVISKSSPPNLIGTAFAIFYGVEALTLFLSNYMAGLSSTAAVFVGLDASAGPFLLGSMATLLAIVCKYFVFDRKIIST